MPAHSRSIISSWGWISGIALLLCFVSIAHGADFKIDGRVFTLPDGFTIERVAGPPLIDRPIEADLDERGRLFVTEAAGAIDRAEFQGKAKPHRALILEDTTGTGRFDKRTVFAEGLTFPEGAMWYRGAFYTSNVPAIWKLTEASGGGVAGERSIWFDGKTATGCGNDLHGPYLGPDGWIYWCKGAFATQTYAREGHKPFVTPAAHIFRARTDGSGIEPVMTGGMDNPVEIVFTPGGERIVSSTFIQTPGGGHRDGLIHAVYGGIYGKVHDVTDDHQHTSPELMPVLSHLGPAAVCGLVRYESDAFGAAYQNNLFATCFNLHKVTRHVLKADGATFHADDQDFLTCDSFDFHPTDVLEDADGSLIVIDTGGWYTLCCPTSKFGAADLLGAIYRIRRDGAPKIDDPRGLKLDWENLTPAQLAAQLDDPRPAVRKRTIQALADKGTVALADIKGSLDPRNSVLKRSNAIWTATRIDDAAARAVVRIALKDEDETVRQVAAHSASVWRDKESLLALIDLLSRPSMATQRVATEGIGRIGNADAIPAILAALQRPLDHVLDHSLTYALIEIGDAKRTLPGLASKDARVRRAALMAMDQMENRELDPQAVIAELNSPDEPLRQTAAWIAGRHPEWGDALVAAFRARLESPELKGRAPEELQRQLSRLCKSVAIRELLASVAGSEESPARRRQLALNAMADSGLQETPANWIDSLGRAISSKDGDVVTAAINATRRLPIKKEASAEIRTRLLAVASRPDVAAEVRLGAMNAFADAPVQVDQKLFEFLNAQLVSGASAANRLDAARALGGASLSDEQLVALIPSIKNAGPIEIDPVLGAFKSGHDRKIGSALVAALEEAKGRRGLRSDKLKLLLASFGPEVEKEAEPLLASLNPDAEKQKHRIDELLATLPKGEVRRGQMVFSSAKTGCVICHAIGYVGGEVGPDLTRVGQVRSERDLLESVLYPSATLVQSYEPVTVIVQKGQSVYGIIRRNDADEIELITGPTQKVRIPKSNVKEIRPGTVSIMPDGLDAQLSPQDLADLLAFLKGAKG